MQETDKQTPKGYSRNRINQLATPKQNYQEYLTSFNERQLVWGDKDGMWNLTPNILKAKCGERTKQLAKPKMDWKDHTNEVHLYTFSCGRASPLLPGQKFGKTNKGKGQRNLTCNSERISNLAQPKHQPWTSKGKLWTFSCGRESPIWNVKKNVINRPSKNDERLALPKLPHRNFAPNRELRQDGRQSARFMMRLKEKGDDICTERLESLAQAKMPKEHNAKWSNKKYLDLGYPEQAIRPVHKSTMEYSATANIDKLAQPNESRFKDYIPDQFEWPVSRGALKHKMSERTEKLSEPVIRPSMEHTQYDMNAFFVKPASLKANCSKRLEELSQPIYR